MEGLTGPIPDHWHIASLGDLCEVQAGSAEFDRAARLNPDQRLPVIAARHITATRLVTDHVGATGESSAGPARYRLMGGDLVFARVGHSPRVALVEAEHAGWVLGGGCLRLRTRSGLNPRYLLHYLHHPAVKDQLRQAATGSVIPTHSVRGLKSLPVALPPEAEQEAIVAVLALIDEKIAVHEAIVQTTAELRDRVLRLLLAGSSVAGSGGPASAARLDQGM